MQILLAFILFFRVDHGSPESAPYGRYAGTQHHFENDRTVVIQEQERESCKASEIDREVMPAGSRALVLSLSAIRILFQVVCAGRDSSAERVAFLFGRCEQTPSHIGHPLVGRWKKYKENDLWDKNSCSHDINSPPKQARVCILSQN